MIDNNIELTKQIIEAASLEDEQGIKRTTEREVKRKFDKALGKETFSEKLKREIREKRLNN